MFPSCLKGIMIVHEIKNKLSPDFYLMKILFAIKELSKLSCTILSNQICIFSKSSRLRAIMKIKRKNLVEDCNCYA